MSINTPNPQNRRKTFIDPTLLPYTRLFSDKEIKSWQEEDTEGINPKNAN